MKNKEGEIINGIIYGVRCTANQKWYIGQTIRGIEKRRRQHLIDARNNYDNYAFHAAIRKYGEDTFDWVVLESDIHTYDELNEAEKYWIQEKNSLLPNGYNMNAGGNGTPNHPISEETRKRLSNARMGHAVSAETRKRLSIANKGKTHSEETRKRLSIAHKGKTLSEETRKRMSDSRRGKKMGKLSEEHKKKLSAAKKGKHLTETHRMHISEALKGIKPVNRKPVLMYDRSGNFVMAFPSLKAAADYIGVNRSSVTKVLTGKQKFAGGGYDKNAGYMFKYKNENPDR